MICHGHNVYFIRPVGQDGPVKIGCSTHTAQRLADLMTWSPLRLEIAFEMPGDFELESNLHHCFADFHSHREWFLPNEKLTKLIVDLKAGVPIADAIDLSLRVGAIRGSIRGRVWTPGRRLCVSYAAKVRNIHQTANSKDGKWFYQYDVPVPVSKILSRWHVKNGKVDGGYMPPPKDLAILDAFLAEPNFTPREAYPPITRTQADLVAA